MVSGESSRPSGQHRRQRDRDRERRRHGDSSRRPSERKRRAQARKAATISDESRMEGGSTTLSLDALARLNREQERRKRRAERGRGERPPERAKRPSRDDYRGDEHYLDKPRKHPKSNKRRVVSGAVMEEGRSGIRGGRAHSEDSMEKEDFYQQPKKKKNKKKLWIILGCLLVLLIIIIAVAVGVSQKKKGDAEEDKSEDSDLDGKDHSEIPSKWQNTYLDPWSWKSTTDFNVTFTDEMVGDLPVMGLYTDWDDSAQANEKVPALNKAWGSYTKKPARGVNLGGWLVLEPFITPSLFSYDTKEGIIDEYTLMKKLGSSKASTMEKHYAEFVTEETFKDIRDAGLDHVRIPFNYWLIEVYDDDPYVYRTGWRYLLRGIEWARKYGLRVNLDLHGLPGSQNGWNHSGRWGSINWLNGTDGETNRKKSVEIHDRLSKFFAQDRYKNIVTHYGLCNEPRMTFLKVDEVIKWSEEIYKLVRKNGMNALLVFGDGFMGLHNWQGKMTGYDDMILDVHQYVIFNENQIDFSHKEKVEYACDGWTKQTVESMDTSTGYGPTLFAEWSQADTDCAKFVTGVGWGNRWEGTYDTGSKSSSILEPRCPTKDDKCSCSKANADPSKWSNEYKKFLKMFAEAQMHSFEKGWGWWYWTWKTESAPQWSYEAGLKAGVMPAKAYDREFDCQASNIPDFEKEGLEEYY